MIRLAKTLWYVLNLRCEEADRIRCIHDPAELRWHERLGEFLHNMLCRSCRSARRKLDTISRAISSHRDKLASGTDDRLSPEARRSITAALHREQERLPE